MPVMMEPRVSRFDLITPAAEKQIDQLQPRDKSKVISTLEKPVRIDRCKKMARERSVPLWRARVTDDIRITFCRVDDKICIVHVGAHACSDHFVDHLSAFALNPKPLKESSVMKKTVVAPSVMNKETPNYQASDVKANGWHDLMERGIKALIGGQMVDELDVMRELVTDQIKDVHTQVNGQAEAITKLTGHVNELAKNIELCKTDNANHAKDLVRIGTSLRSELKRQGEELTQVIADAAQEGNRGIAKVTEQFTQITDKAEARINAVAEAGHGQEQRTTQLGVEVARLSQELTNTHDATKKLADCVDQLQGALVVIGKDLSRLAEQHDSTTTMLKELKAREEAAAACSWAARWRRWIKSIRGMFWKKPSSAEMPAQASA